MKYTIEEIRISQKNNRLKPMKFIIVFMYYSIYKLRSSNENKPHENIIKWLNEWRSYSYWRANPFLASFGKLKIKDPYAYYNCPYVNIKYTMLVCEKKGITQ